MNPVGILYVRSYGSQLYLLCPQYIHLTFFQCAHGNNLEKLKNFSYNFSDYSGRHYSTSARTLNRGLCVLQRASESDGMRGSMI